MALPITTQKRADTVSLGVLLVGFGIITYYQNWWPTVLLAIGASLIARQTLRGRHYDTIITSIVFGGLFSYFYFKIDWASLMAVLFCTGGIYLIFREYFVSKERVGKEKLEEEKQEIEEESKKDE